MRRDLHQHAAERVTRHDDEHVTRASQRRGEIRLDDERVAETRRRTDNARCGGSAPIASNCSRSRPHKPGRMAAARELDGERGAP